MKTIKVIALAISLTAFCTTSYAQLNMAGFGLSQGYFQTKDAPVNINNTLNGGHAFIETPLGKYSFRADIAYLVRFGEAKGYADNIDNLLHIRIGYGKVIGEGKKFQIPLFGSVGYYGTQGDLVLKNYAVGARAGFRLFVSNKVAVFAEASGDYIFGKEAEFVNPAIVNVKPIHTQLNIGVMYMYLQKKK